MTKYEQSYSEICPTDRADVGMNEVMVAMGFIILMGALMGFANFVITAIFG